MPGTNFYPRCAPSSPRASLWATIGSAARSPTVAGQSRCSLGDHQRSLRTQPSVAGSRSAHRGDDGPMVQPGEGSDRRLTAAISCLRCSIRVYATGEPGVAHEWRMQVDRNGSSVLQDVYVDFTTSRVAVEQARRDDHCFMFELWKVRRQPPRYPAQRLGARLARSTGHSLVSNVLARLRRVT
jgi:hypothetical protein